jgi:two-component system, NarL family, nitrate/nitrite response regulator NarL
LGQNSHTLRTRAKGLSPDATRVVIVDDHKLFAEAIQSSLRDFGIEVGDVASSRAEALEVIDRIVPDIVLMDLGLPDGNGIEVGRSILARYPGIKVLALTARSDPTSVKQVMRAGFSGFLTKDTPLDKLAAAIRLALDGHVIIPHRVAGAAAGARSPEQENAELLASQLTPRELEVLALLVQGAGSNAIADSLSVSMNTVRTHIQSILTKLQVKSRLGAAAFAVRYNVVPSSDRVNVRPPLEARR